MNTSNIEDLRQLLETPKKVVIVSHRSPDGDSVGSSLGWAHFLAQAEHQITVITPDPMPAFLHWLPGADELINFEKNETIASQHIQEADLIFCLDFNALHRMGAMGELVGASKAYKVNVDHHREPDLFADWHWINEEVGSTAELIFELIEGLGQKEALTSDIATCLYTGMVTDSGSFRFASTRAETHRIAAEFLNIGIDHTRIHEQVFNNYSEERLRLLGYALSSNLKIFSDYRTAIIHLDQEELKRFNFKKGDTEGLVNFPLSIGSIKMSILITQQDDRVKMSFRSKGDFSVNELARTHFNGGGHLNAAGGISDRGVLETVDRIKAILPDYLASLAQS